MNKTISIAISKSTIYNSNKYFKLIGNKNIYNISHFNKNIFQLNKPRIFNSKCTFKFCDLKDKINQGKTNTSRTDKKANQQNIKNKDQTKVSEDQTDSPNSDANSNSQQNSKQIESFEQMFNLHIGLEKNHSFKNDLVVSQQNYKKSLKELKQAILFEDLLKKQIDIHIYDTEGKPFYHHLLKIFLMLLTAVGSFIIILQALKTNKKFKVIVQKTASGKIFVSVLIFMGAFICFRVLIRHAKMTKRYVQRIVYHTQNEKFTFTRRKFIGRKYEQQISRFKLLYTQNQFLNKRGTNYLNIENQNQYFIGYHFAWKKQDLFSHLISQRIKK